MSDAPLNPPVWVARPVDLDRMIRMLAGQNIIAVDTEANSLHAFREQVCLIQFSIPEVDYLVDPLALADLSPLESIFSSPKIEKVFHAAEYDIIGLKRDFGFTFRNLFDTMQAGRILARPAVGLASMLEAEFGLHLDKRYQRANWGQRPLPPALLAYARLDTHYLIDLRHRLARELQESGRWPVAAEDFYRLTLIQPGSNHLDDSEGCWRVAGSQQLTPQQNAVLMELCIYRSRQAEAADLPLFKVLGNATLVQLAQALPQHLDEMYGIEGLSPRLIERHGHALLSAIQRGLRAEPLTRPHQDRPSEAYLDRLDRLRDWRKLKARDLLVESDVVLPRDVLEAIAMQNPRTVEELAGLMHDLPWRFEHYGADIIKVLRG